MQQRILVIGSGFAGMWAALGAARVLDQHGRGDVEVALVAPEPLLHLRPRLHEAAPHAMTTPLLPLFEAAGVRYVQGSVERIHTGERSVEAVNARGERFSLAYDRLVLTAGSRLFRPAIPGLAEHAFSIDQTDEASALDVHLARLADLPPSDARNTVVVAGGGFTGIEIACELPARVRRVLGEDAEVRVVIVERSHVIGPDLGPGPRPQIEQALDELGVVRFLGAAVNAIDADGLSTTTGERIEAKTVIWTAGMQASPLTAQVPGERDALGRLHVTRDLRVKGVDAVFAAGDVALAQVDDAGNHSLMSCQHAMNMGRSAGYNVAADLLGLPTQAYAQPVYVTCLDLGPWGAVYTEGWERQVKLQGAEAKALKRQINTQWIYPPQPSRKAALEAADPQRVVVA
ncbi:MULTISPECIES: NAD(P)/FAD-dependent oxidoreductase [unclassified Pseudomonas]|uniref:NAD(P)/FAD-dependent oxidoreductase n=1 Tax=unclassified Pseudomonas TaxID=196821 RepID=UPI0002A2C253|nr:MULTISPECIES: NAD(P)/FAD-dependent oxidoreductase [unclassified Pseudomonas]MBB1608727.1 pyridine nucleotide-disulfide oxidoreductase [Pseudomonas sp. UMC76]MBB1636965.1 pyridine nucleotide-disulfide oxidoreductase [Pseudomonas sp. UME83]NTX88832.1 NAD(P)/FAD-dependent oxidoreductase [Pseudomonas sp. UMA643]NTY17379.1 NAD(P)/FAD-dependent oxidoreductase [Pseudomonas sp. UMC3103]NTY24877.1 NAD(P)/FAD-dependent oxidoreductase [Pseudomonas sp. UMA603]